MILSSRSSATSARFELPFLSSDEIEEYPRLGVLKPEGSLSFGWFTTEGTHIANPTAPC